MNAIDILTHCTYTSLMPPSMLLLAIAILVDCYFAAALVCGYEHGSKPPMPVSPPVVPPTPTLMVPIMQD